MSVELDPTQIFYPAHEVIVDDNDIAVVTSNVSTGSTSSLASTGAHGSQMRTCTHHAPTNIRMQPRTHPMKPLESAFSSSFVPRQESKWAYAALTIASNEAIADSGATQIFVMDGIPVHNRQKTTCPLKVALADGRRVMLTHMCDIIIPGLPTTLVGHIIPELSIASLFGIRVLTAAGCTVKFDIKKCVVKYNGKIILTGVKDPATDLWTLPIVGSAGKTSQMDDHDEQDAFDNLRDEFLEKPNAAYSTEPSSLAIPLCASTQACGTIQTGMLKDSQTPRRTNSVSSHIPSDPRPTASSSHTNRCAAPRYQHSSKQSGTVTSTDALISQLKE